MSVLLECKKAKRTGFVQVFLGGGILSAAVPVVNMAVRSQLYVTQQGSPVRILFQANWQVMAMLNILLVLVGACLLYHTEFADNAMLRIRSLPVRESSVFAGKAVLIIGMSAMVLAVEAAAVLFCSYYWFAIGEGFWNELGKSFGYAFVLLLPCIFVSLVVSETWQNMWVSLGIGVLCVFLATILPADSFLLSLFPYATPFQMLADTDKTQVLHYLSAVSAEILAVSLIQAALTKVRRLFS